MSSQSNADKNIIIQFHMCHHRSVELQCEHEEGIEYVELVIPLNFLWISTIISQTSRIV